MSDVKQSSVMNCKGYTFIELMVALAVSSIVIAGSYAGYSLLARQQQFLNAQTSLDRNALRVVDLIQSDIRMAGYNDLNLDPMDRLNAVKVASSNDDLLLIYDDYDEFKNPYRALVHYYVESYTSSVTGKTRKRLMRDFRKCRNVSTDCDLIFSDTKYQGPILDWVNNFTVIGEDDFTQAKKFQGVYIKLQITPPDKIEGTTTSVAKNFNFRTRVKNVSLAQ